MKVKRTDWETLHRRLAELEGQVREAKLGTLMTSKTGPVLLNVVVPSILRHLHMESRHGYSDLQPESEEPEHG